MKEFYARLVKPMIPPMVIAALLFLVVWALSRIFLAVPEFGATTLALLIAAEILGVCAVIAAAVRFKPVQKTLAVILGLTLVAGGGVAAAIGERDFHHHDEVGVFVSSVNIEFDRTILEVPADEPFDLTFENLDAGVPHNVSIYTDETMAEPLFIGEIFNGVATLVYEVPAIPEGTHFFVCDVHPNMTGSVIAGDPTEEPGVPATRIEITAEGIAFDRDEMLLAADQAITIVFHNLDNGVPHNVSIWADEARTEPIHEGETFNGVATRTEVVPPTPAGEYIFICDVHPSMIGTARFE